MLKRHSVVYFALSSVAFTQPITDLYGRNLTAFSAAKLSPAEVTAFLVLLVAGPTAVLTSVDAVFVRGAERTRRLIHLTLIWPLLLLIAMLICNSADLSNDAVVYPLSAVAATLLTWTYARRSALRLWISWLSLVGVIAGATFVAQAWSLIRPPEPTIASATIADTTTPVLIVILDELPLYALLDQNGGINAERFPAFARLEHQSTWYPDTTAAANYTDMAVPGILASTTSDFARYPTLAGYPRNLFTLLGGVTTLSATEPITSLCPRSVCSSARVSPSGFKTTRFRDFVLDAGVVYAQRTLPASTRAHLPTNNRAWNDFIRSEPGFLDTGGVINHLGNIVEAAQALTSARPPQISMVHAETPHFPWYMTPTRQVALNVPNFGRNSSEEGLLLFSYQRMLYQLGATDAALGDAFGQLDAAGIWDEAMVIVTADHGISFIAGQDQRYSDLSSPDQVSDIYRVPLFVKYPHQTTGAVSPCAAATIDVVPTIIDVLGVQSDWRFDGRSLAGERCPERAGRTITNSQRDSIVLDDGFESTLARLAYYGTLVPASGDLHQVARVGASAPLIGTKIDLDTLPSAADQVLWSLDGADVFDNVSLARGARSPVIVSGGLVGDFAPGSEIVVVVNGVAAGATVVGGLSDVSRFGVVLDYGLFDTEGASYGVELVLRGADGQLARIGPPNFVPN